ncbi:uncharacterized protein [Oryctolagus cuniculus]|uniref:uncharacterized protein isoform X1 n=1 Tax=Oryctolagus cuniculus TaxID=9986 RepID=UPI0038791101
MRTYGCSVYPEGPASHQPFSRTTSGSFGHCTAVCVSAVKPWVCRLLSVLCVALSWALALSLVCSTSWHLWEFRSNLVPFVSIEFWAAVYYQWVNVSGALRAVPMCSHIDSSWVLPAKMEYGRDLLFFTNFAKAAALLLGWAQPGFRELPELDSKTSTLFLALSGGCTLTAMTWNVAADRWGHNALGFPFLLHFPMARDSLVRAHGTYVLPLSLATAGLTLASALLVFLREVSWYSGVTRWRLEQTTWADNPAPWAESPQPGLRAPP